MQSNLPENRQNQNTNWDSEILKDISFIKKHKRYPISSKTIGPTLFIGFLFIIVARFAGVGFILFNAKQTIAQYLLLVVVIISVIALILQYYRTLKFMEISNDSTLAQNKKLLIKFFQHQQLAHSQHPEAPEVLAIISKNLKTKGEHREVMLFLIDDKKILINSHFTGSKFTVTPQSKHYRQMASRLKDWLQIHASDIISEETAISKF